jgi:hypothetical protein
MEVTRMSTISSTPTASEVSAAIAQSAAVQLSVINTLASMGGNSAAPSTYNFADLLSAFQQTTPSTSGNATTGAQAAQNAFLGVEYAITQTLSSLLSGSSPDTSNADIFSLVNPAGTSATNGLFGSSSGTFLNGFTGSTSAEVAHYAVLNAQYAVSQALNSLTSSSSPKSSSGA